MTDRLEQLQALLEKTPNDPFCLYGLAQEYDKRGDGDRAVEYFDRTLRADPDYLYAYYHKARCLDDDGRTDAAVETLRAGLDRARACGDEKATSEMQVFLDAIT